MLEVSHVSKSFASAGKNDVVHVLDDVNLKAKGGDFVVLVGPSGCGKSTLLRMVAGLTVPTTGRVLLDGEEVRGPDYNRGMVFQKPTLFPWLTVEENVEFGLRVRGKTDGMGERASEMLELAGLGEFRDAYPHQLSGGMAQRVALVRTMVNSPKVFLLDEPLGALDAFTRMGMQDALLDMWHSQNGVLLMVTHDVDEAAYLGTKVLVMTPRPGRIMEEIPIDLPYRRNRTSEAFMRYRNHILDLLDFGKDPDRG